VKQGGSPYSGLIGVFCECSLRSAWGKFVLGSLWLRADVRNVSFCISLGRSIYLINSDSVDKFKQFFCGSNRSLTLDLQPFNTEGKNEAIKIINVACFRRCGSIFPATFNLALTRASRDNLQNMLHTTPGEKSKPSLLFPQLATQFCFARQVAKRGCYTRNFVRNLSCRSCVVSGRKNCLV